MTLKVQINGTKKDITRRGYAPVTFINGVKKYVVKGITFVNGQKKVLWDLTTLKIDYITGHTAVVATTQYPVMVNDKYMITSNKQVFKFNIENLSDISVESAPDWGTVRDYSSFDSTNNSIFYAHGGISNRTYRAQALSINPQTMDMEIIQTRTESSAGLGVQGYFANENWIGGGVNAIKPFTASLSNNLTQIAQWNTESTAFGVTKISSDDGLVTYNRIGEYGIAVVNPTGLGEEVATAPAPVEDIMRDSSGNIIITAQNNFITYSSSYEVLGTDTLDETKVLRLIGQIREYYYVIEHATNDVDDNSVYLRVYTLNGTLFTRVRLNVLLLRKLSGGGYVHVVPSVSQTGYLLVCIQPRLAGQPTQVAIRIQGY